METMFSLFMMEFVLFSLIGIACAVEFFDMQTTPTITTIPPLLYTYSTHSPRRHSPRTTPDIFTTKLPPHDHDLDQYQYEYQSDADPTPDYYDTTSLTSIGTDTDLYYDARRPGHIMKYDPPPPYSLYPQGTRRNFAKRKIKGACKRIIGMSSYHRQG
ncbi:hypothetical protein Cantr_07328 [Candida viswanathii]|uniref:Uncharacterized protein n=1 Tax=Candida viswanathii TaxID=5486 RepID=A0A367Y3Q3_9ASCO|nr:hypothetical protein Cantr_07328 [Candida viswanathii]